MVTKYSCDLFRVPVRSMTKAAEAVARCGALDAEVIWSATGFVDYIEL